MPDQRELKRLIALRDDLTRRIEVMEGGARETHRQRVDRIKKGHVVTELKRQGARNTDALWGLVRDRFRLDAQRQTVAGTPDQPRSVAAEVAIIRQAPVYQHFFAPGQYRSIGDANPFASGTRNATAATALMRTDPAKARKLYDSAVQDGSIDPLLRDAFASWV